jgi:[ribosomal protein S5]-alanine N-acetyltransferase
MLLESQRLIIRPYTPEDVQKLYGVLSDPETMAFWPKPFSLSQVEDWIHHRGIAKYGDGMGRCGVFLKKTGDLVGDAGIVSQDIDGKPEYDLGYIIHAKYWGHGYGGEAAAEIMRYGFEELQLPRLCANMPAEHISSRRVAEKLGMLLEKEFINRRNRDVLTCLYSKNKV